MRKGPVSTTMYVLPPLRRLAVLLTVECGVQEGLELMTKQLCEDKAWIETLATTTRPVEDEDGSTGIADDLKREHNL